MGKNKFSWPALIMPAIALLIWIGIFTDSFPAQGMRRRMFMTACLAGAHSTTSNAIAKCYGHFLDYEALHENGFMPKNGGRNG